MVGIDEDTALVGSLRGEWKVMGKSEVHVFTGESKTTYQVGEIVPIRRKQPENLHRKVEKRKNKENHH